MLKTSVDQDLMIPFSTVTADLGNNRINFIFQGQHYQDMPNLIALCDEEEKGMAVSNGSPWDWIKVKIDSPALEREWGAIAIGKAAYSYTSSYVAPSQGDKWKDDQTILHLLAGIATDALQYGRAQDRDGTYYLKSFLSTFLPMREYKNPAYRQHFQQKLLNGKHRVEFLNTVPSHRNQVITIEFLPHIELNPEGMGNHIRLKYHPNGEERNLFKTDQTYVTLDLGGGTTDEAYLKEGEICDPKLSRGHDIGINQLLDQIRDNIHHDPELRGFQFQNRDEVNQVLLQGARDPDGRYFIEWHGIQEEVTHLVIPCIHEFVEFQLFPMMEKIFQRSEIQALYMVGGTSVWLNKFVKEQNEKRKRSYPTYFTDDHTAYWGLIEAGDMLGFEYRLEQDLLLPEEREGEE